MQKQAVVCFIKIIAGLLHHLALHYITQVCLINWSVGVYNGTVSEICQAESPTVSPERVRREHPTCSWSQSLTRQFVCLSLLAVQFDNYPGRGKKKFSCHLLHQEVPCHFPPPCPSPLDLTLSDMPTLVWHSLILSLVPVSFVVSVS